MAETSVTYPSNYAESCGSRLPCGLCMITNQPCPYALTWGRTEITCVSNSYKVEGRADNG